MSFKARLIRLQKTNTEQLCVSGIRCVLVSDLSWKLSGVFDARDTLAVLTRQWLTWRRIQRLSLANRIGSGVSTRWQRLDGHNVGLRVKVVLYTVEVNIYSLDNPDLF